MNEEDLDKLLARPSRHFKRAASWAAPTASGNNDEFGAMCMQQSITSLSRRCDAKLRIRVPGKENIQLPTQRADILSPSSFVFPSISSLTLQNQNQSLLSPKAHHHNVVKAIREEDSGADSSSGPDSPMNVVQKKLMPALHLRAPFTRVASHSTVIGMSRGAGTDWMRS